MRKLMIFAAIAVLGACSDNTVTSPVNNQVTIHVTPDSLVLAPGQTQALSASVAGTSVRVTFMSSNVAVATVDTAGVVTARGNGSTYIVAAAGTVRDSTKIIVRSTTASPRQLPLLGTGFVTERYTAEVAAAGTWAYTTTWYLRSAWGNAVKIWNVSGDTPVLTDSLTVPCSCTTSDVQISDDGKLMAVSIELASSGNGFVLYDRTNPAKPTVLSQYTSAAVQHGVHTLKFGRVNGRLYLFMSIDPSPPSLVVVDVTDPSHPVEVLNRQMGNPYIHDVFVRDGVLFAALWNDGMSIFDIGGAGRGGSPSNPVLMGSVKTANCDICGDGTSSVHNIWWYQDPNTGSKRYAFIGEEGPSTIGTRATGDIHVVDVSDFNNPREVAFFAIDSTTSNNGRAAGTHNFDVDEPSGVLYAAYYNGGVRALDIRGDLGTCTAEQKATDGRCNLRLMGREIGVGVTGVPSAFVWGVKLVGNYLYASDMLNGLRKLDISALKR